MTMRRLRADKVAQRQRLLDQAQQVKRTRETSGPTEPPPPESPPEE